MRLELAKYLFDIQQAARTLSDFVAGRNWGDYERNAMLRAAVERQFEIIGEAMSQLARRDASVATAIDDYRDIIAFRNILIHGYADIDDRLVWDIVQTRLPTLRKQVDALLESPVSGD
ncbi:MAG: HepT-like ribonuclease domain-containing protein [Metallibacterium sp.]